MSARPEQLITTALWDAAKARSGRKPEWMFIAVQTRIRDLLKERDDQYEVELVCRLIEERDQDRFNPASLWWTSYDYFRRQRALPPGAWEYALVMHGLGLPQEGESKRRSDLRYSLEYWLGMWADGHGAAVWDLVDKARDSLERLLDDARATEGFRW